MALNEREFRNIDDSFKRLPRVYVIVQRVHCMENKMIMGNELVATRSRLISELFTRMLYYSCRESLFRFLSSLRGCVVFSVR